MWIERSDYLPAAESLSWILDRYEEEPVRKLYQDFLSQGLFNWGERAIAIVAFQAVWKNSPHDAEEHLQTHDQLVSELVQTLLINPLNSLPYDQPMLCGDWTLEPEQWKKMQLYFGKSTSPLDGCPIATCPPTPHLFAREMVAWKKQWIKINVSHPVCIHLPSAQRIEKQESALDKPMQSNWIERFKWTQLCSAAASRRRLQNVRELAKGVLIHCHNQQIAQDEQTSKMVQQATTLACCEEETLCTQLESGRKIHTSKMALLAEALRNQTLAHQKANNTWLIQGQALHASEGQKIDSLRQAVACKQEELQEELTIKKTQVEVASAKQAAETEALHMENIQASQELARAMNERAQAKKEAWETQKTLLDKEGEIEHLNRLGQILDKTHGHQLAHIEILKKG